MAWRVSEAFLGPFAVVETFTVLECLYLLHGFAPATIRPRSPKDPRPSPLPESIFSLQISVVMSVDVGGGGGGIGGEMVLVAVVVVVVVVRRWWWSDGDGSSGLGVLIVVMVMWKMYFWQRVVVVLVVVAVRVGLVVAVVVVACGDGCRVVLVVVMGVAGSDGRLKAAFLSQTSRTERLESRVRHWTALEEVL